MASASVHLAVLVIAKDPVRADLAAGDVIATRAAAAGHRVISRHSVDDSEAAIRSQLARWIDDRQVDVVVVLSGGSPTVKKTLATLVTEPVPGLPDAIRCGATFVFVVPGAAGPGMDKLVLPHLDPAKPSGLIGQIPRLQAKEEGVPLPIAPEKTEGGSGVPARMPASVGTRAKQKTGANVISRHKPVEDPPTKPIDVARLERQLAKSTTPSHDDVTRPEIALILPRLPPGATVDTDDDDDDQLDDHTATDTVAVQPAPPLPPAGRPRPATGAQRTVPSVVKPKPSGEPKPFAFSTPVRGGPPSPPRERTSTGTPAYSAKDTKPPIPREPTAAGTPAYSAKDAKPRSSSPSTPAPPREPWRAKSTSSGTPAYPAVTPPVPVVPVPVVPAPKEVVAELEPDAEDSAENEAKWAATIAAAKAEPEDAVENEAKWAATIAAAKADAEAATAKAEADAEAATAKAEAEAATARAEAAAAKAEAAAVKAEAAAARAKAEAATAMAEAEAARATADAEAAAARAQAEAPPTQAEAEARAEAAADVVDVPELVEVSELDTEAPPPARVRQPTTPPPVRVRQPTTPPPVPGRPVRTPTVPPPVNITDNDLPRGAFTYPAEPRRSNVVLKVVAAIGVTVLGFFAVVYFLDKKDPSPTKVATGTPAPPLDAPAVVVAVAPDAAEPDIEIDTSEPAPPTGSAALSGGSASTPTTPTTRPRPGTPAPRPVTTPNTTSGGDSTVPDPTPPPDPQFTEADLCDEANCVLSDYDRPCCAKYKAKGPVLSQRIGGVPQTLDRSMVRAGVDGIKPRVIKCGENAGVKGTVKIAVSVSPDGAVTGADVQDTPDAALGTCVADALRAAKFGKSIDGGSFTYPFVF